MKKFLAVLGISLISTTLVARELTLIPDGKLHTYILDVGQGDSILLISPSGKQILIDGGPDLSTLEHLGKYMSFFDRSIDLIVLTHPHADHLTSLPEILKRYKVHSLMLTGIKSKNSRYLSLLNEAQTKNISTIIANSNKDFDSRDGIFIDIIHPYKSIDSYTLNNSSIVLKITYKDQSILLTGDIEEETEIEILKAGTDIRSNILKAAHHGSKTSSLKNFLSAVDPNTAVISVGEDNKYSHPSPEVISRFEDMNIDIKRTDEDGTIHLIFN